VIDIHCHILPEVDDGPKSWETAETMCRMSAQDGIEHIVATPHANDRYYYDRPYLSDLLSRLQEKIGDTPKLSLGCDFHLSFENMANALQAPERYCIGDTQYLLVEPSNFSVPQQIDEWLTQLQERNITAIITHPERNPILQQTGDRVLGWIELGCAVQVTASAITGSWGTRAQQTAQWLLKKKAVHIVATDAHDLQRRPPVLSEAAKAIANDYGEDLARALVEGNPGAVVRNEPLPYFSKQL
jgi:protein-tyrosine phosphatase